MNGGSTGAMDMASPTSTTDMSTPVNTGPWPATLPQVVPTAGALTRPHIVPVFFPNNLLRTQLTTYVQNYVASSASYAVMKEYGTTSTTVGNAVVLSTAPASNVTDADVQALIAARVADSTLPAADGNTMYLFFFPQSTTITNGSSVSCQDFAGYHSWSAAGTATALYAVIPQCSATALPTTLPSITVAASHEITETVTDPIGKSLYEMNDPYSLWFAPFSGNEVADMCEWLSDYAVNEVGIGYTARIWSNAAMRNRKNPCLPVPTPSSFFAIPIMPEQRQVQIGTAVRTTELVSLVSGTPKTIDVRLISDATPAPTITVEALEIPIPTTTAPAPATVLSFAWQEAPGQPRASAIAGSTLHLQLTANTAPASGYTTFRMYATITLSGNVKTQTMWAGQVTVR